jgi:hypothetical protein
MFPLIEFYLISQDTSSLHCSEPALVDVYAIVQVCDATVAAKRTTARYKKNLKNLPNDR